MTHESGLAALEAILFLHGEPIARKKLSKILGLNDEELAQRIGALGAELAKSNRGLMLIEQGDALQLSTKPELHAIIEGFIKSELTEELSPASLETLAVIAYFGPISRSRVDYQRGVNCSFIVRSLILRGLIDRAPDPARQNSFVYSPSFDLLRHLGVSRQGELPEYEKFSSILERVASETRIAERHDEAASRT